MENKMNFKLNRKIKKFYIGFIIEYFNTERINNMDFLRLIKKDCLYTLSKALSIKYEDEGKRETVDFQINYTQDNGVKYYFCFCFTPKCDMSVIFPSDEFSNDFLNDREESKEFTEALINKKVIIDSFWACVYTNTDKVLRKNKFYKDLHNDLIVKAWHPSRYLDWCLDIEELKFLKELWGED